MIENFKAAIETAGLSAPDSIVPDGNLYRFHVDGDRPASKNGYYICFDDPPAGAFGCWKRDIHETWSQKPTATLSGAEKEAYRAKLEAAKAVRNAEQEQVRAEARARAAHIWEMSEPAPPDHPYLIKKGLSSAHGLRLYKGSLVVPVRQGQDLHGLQFIAENGDKTFLSGTAKRGSYFVVGKKPEKALYLAEGFATAASIHEAVGDPCVVCFDAGNLKHVAKANRERFPLK